MSGKKLTVIFWSAIVVGIIVVIFLMLPKEQELFSSTIEDATIASGEDRMELTGDITDLVIGDPNAPVTIEEFSDFKCPSCGEYHQEAGKKIKEEYVDTGKAKIVLRAFPYLGPDSGRALHGAYCANEQTLFPEYYNSIFDYMWFNHYKNGNEGAQIEDILTEELLSSEVRKIGGDQSQFIECLNSPSLRYNVDNDLIRGADYSVQGTPTNIIAGKKIVGNKQYSVYKTVIDIQLK